MKNTNIQKIRQLLTEIKTAGGKTQRDVFYYLKADQALALLPCETCNDTGKIPKKMSKKPNPCNYVNSKRAEITVDCPDCVKGS